MTGKRKLLLPLLLLAAGCDTAPGLDDPGALPPEITDLTFSPTVVQIDTLPSSARQGDDVVVTLDIAAVVTDPDDDIAEVGFVLRFPVGSDEPVAAGLLTGAAGNTWTAQPEVRLPVALTGDYVLVLYASDSRGVLSNEARGTLQLAGGLEPPVITEIDMPDRVQRPAAGGAPVPIPLVAVVEDPDGLANIARVEVRFDGGSPLLLCDDGGQGACNPGFGSGDATAGDGRFTLTIQINENNSPGERTLTFVATDRSGLMSEPVTRVLTIE
ncbi:MAG: hypothetical protein JJ896_12155 [Rhodothermales bacterium]|nr:hypothetical protein [Rhodothermales bacterium]MBO6780397.1 hypothetical protein [Rhodothermales bacterium]